MGGICKRTCNYSSYLEHLLNLASTVIGCVSISEFFSLVCLIVGIKSSAVGLNICAITTRIKTYKLVSRKKVEQA